MFRPPLPFPRPLPHVAVIAVYMGHEAKVKEHHSWRVTAVDARVAESQTRAGGGRPVAILAETGDHDGALLGGSH